MGNIFSQGLFNHAKAVLGVVFLITIFSGATPSVDVVSLGDLKVFPPLSPTQEVIFIGLEGLQYPRWVGCESQTIGTIRAMATGCYNPETKTFPEGTIPALKEKARELGGDTVTFFNGPCSGIDAQVSRRTDGNCNPILLFLEGSEQVLGNVGCEYEIVGPLLNFPIGKSSSSESYFGVIRGAFADSVHSRSGEGLWVTESDGILCGRVLRFRDPACKGWVERK